MFATSFRLAKKKAEPTPNSRGQFGFSIQNKPIPQLSFGNLPTLPFRV